MKILVTGFSGTLGSHLVPMLLEAGHSVIGYSRDELKQQQFPRHENLTMYLGDVRDSARILEASRGVELLFHLAALKHVDKLEENPEESIKTNIEGTQNVLHAQRINHIPRVVLSSTDKACYPINVYGMTKAIAEKLVLRNPNNIVIRYGNVIASRGSVVPMFKETLEKYGVARITHRNMTRFFITPDAAAKFVYLSSQRPVGGLCIPKMQAYPVVKLAGLIAQLKGINQPIIEEIGIRPGEKLHENLRREDEGGEVTSADNSLWFQPNELKDLIAGML